MFKNEDVICISSIDWDFIWQGHQEIMSSLAKNNNRVIFIENTGVRAPGIRDISRVKARIKNWLKGIKGIRKEMDNLYVFSPLILPFPYSRIARWINLYLILPVLEKWMKTMNFNNPIVWTFLPTPLSSDLMDNLMKKISIYYCIDNFSASSASVKKIRKSEIKLLKKADLVFVTSRPLYDYCSKYNSKVTIFPFAVNFHKFEAERLKKELTIEGVSGIKKPVIGYVGGVHKWIDQGLIKEVAQGNPGYSFVFLGPLQTDVSLLSKLPNIYFLGHKSHDELPRYIRFFDVCLIPYLVTDYTRNVYPTKLNEYLAMGKPVVSTFLPEITGFNAKYGDIVYVAKNTEDFSASIKSAISQDNQGLRERRIEIAKDNSWQRQIERMAFLIEEEINRKKIGFEAAWRDNLAAFYRLARRKFFKISLVFAVIYLVFFKTPFIWFIASPLGIADKLQPADAIVAFGGGVGESGSPGKSTIERARYASELYKHGYAKKIIFSSGYIFGYNDAENMKLFALSMGVPEKDIALEQNAGSTYENVKFTEAILEKEKLNSILLVSSRYNMKRASLVFKKISAKRRIIYAPVPKAQFYDRKIGSKWQQLRAILHEYLGIIYYWQKGWL